jgi:MFS family permease
MGKGPLLVVGAVVSAVGVLLMGFVSNGYVAGALFAVSSSGVMVWNVLTMSLRQSLIPHELFGRVQGAYRTLVWGAIPLGSLTGGLVAHAAGLRWVFVTSGGGLLLMAVVLAFVLRGHADELAAEPVTVVEAVGTVEAVSPAAPVA